MTSTATRHAPLGVVVLAFAAFIALGMPDGLLGVAWPSIRAGFGLPLDAAGALVSASVAGYLTASFLSETLMARLGVGGVLAASCALTGAGLVGYTLAPHWGVMVALGVATGLGAGAIDAGLNTYAATHFSAGVMQWLHASYGVGITLGPVLMTAALTSLNAWQVGYAVVARVQVVLAGCFALTLPRWSHPTAPTHEAASAPLTLRAALGHGRVWVSGGLFFLYTGCEVGLGLWAYSLLTEARGVEPALAGLLAGGYWAMFTVGRVVAGLYANQLSPRRLVQGSLLLAALGAAGLAWNPAPWANVVAVAVIGLAIAPVFPALMSDTQARVGSALTAHTIGLQMALGGLGAALIPSLLGVLAGQMSLEVVPLSLTGLFVAQVGGLALAARLSPR